jgi:hypothetical protein
VLTALGVSLSCTAGSVPATLTGSISSTTKVTRHKGKNGKVTSTTKVFWHGAFKYAEPSQRLSMTFVPTSASVNRNLVLTSTCVARVTINHKKHKVQLHFTISPRFAVT